MSVEGAIPLPAAWIPSDPRERHVLRYALGATLAVGFASFVDWPLAHVIPVLSLTLLASPKPAPNARQAAFLVGSLMVAVVAGLLVIKYMAGSAIVFIGGLGLLLLHVFYAQCSGAPAILVLWLLMTLMILPFIGVQSPEIAVLVAANLVVVLMCTVVISWIAHGLFPETRTEQPAASGAAAATSSPRERFEAALERFVVVFPVLLLFHIFEWSGALVTLIFVALLSIQPGFASSFKGGIALVLGNAMGGAAAIAGFVLLSVVPQLSFYLLFCLFAGLFFGGRLLGGGKFAPLFGMAYSTMLLILGGNAGGGGDALSAAILRVLQIMIAAVYVVVAFGFLRRWKGAA